MTALDRQDLPCTYTSWTAYTLLLLYYITIVIIMAFVAEYWIGTLVPAP